NDGWDNTGKHANGLVDNGDEAELNKLDVINNDEEWDIQNVIAYNQLALAICLNSLLANVLTTVFASLKMKQIMAGPGRINDSNSNTVTNNNIHHHAREESSSPSTTRKG
ncbi:3800_t:CDS:2, partial [Entrophospora sp. SA101]